jgi:hypothetical protein
MDANNTRSHCATRMHVTTPLSFKLETMCCDYTKLLIDQRQIRKQITSPHPLHL